MIIKVNEYSYGHFDQFCLKVCLSGFILIKWVEKLQKPFQKLKSITRISGLELLTTSTRNCKLWSFTHIVQWVNKLELAQFL